MGGLTFTEGAHGEGYVKQKNRSYQPKAVGTRNNMRELGGGSTLCKLFRYTFLSTSKLFTGQDTCGRLNGRFRAVIAAGDGVWGERTFDLKAHPEPLVGFQFVKLCSVREVLTEALLDLELKDSRDLVRWQLPDFVPRKIVTAPEGATHCQLVLVATVVHPAAYDPTHRLYRPVTAMPYHTAGVVYSDPIALTAERVAGFTLETVPSRDLPVPEASAVVVCAGVLFGTLEQGRFVLLKDGRALDVLGVG